MTNATFLKYHNLFTVNNGYNDLFGEWLKANYDVTVSTAPWSYGEETFTDKLSGERVPEEHIMQIYVKSRRPYFKDFGEVDEWWNSDVEQAEWFAKKGAKR